MNPICSGESQAPSTHMRLRKKTQTFLPVLAFRLHVNDEWVEAFPPKTETFENAFEGGDFRW